MWNVARAAAPPAGPKSSHREGSVGRCLFEGAEEDGRGKAFGSSGQFFLPDRPALSPDAAGEAHVALAKLSRREKRSFPYLVPEFLIPFWQGLR